MQLPFRLWGPSLVRTSHLREVVVAPLSLNGLPSRTTPMAVRLLVAGLLVFASLGAGRLSAQGNRGCFPDSTDGRLDLSEWRLHRKGLLLVPIVVTEPAVSHGGGASALFFSQSLAEGRERSGRLTPPTIAGGGGLYTSGGSYGGAAGVFHPFGQDRFRYSGGVGAASLISSSTASIPMALWRRTPGVRHRSAVLSGIRLLHPGRFGLAVTRERSGWRHLHQSVLAPRRGLSDDAL